MAKELEIIILFLVIVLGSLITAWLYRRIVSGIVIREEKREVTQVGRFYGTAKERKVRKR